MANYPNITVKTQTANFFRADGMRVMEDFIMSTPEIDAVFGANDEMVLGGIEAMEASGKFDFSKVITVGFDAIDDAKVSIRAGILTGTIEQFPSKQAAQGFQVLYDFVHSGKRPASEVVLLEPQVITRENIDSAYAN
jgi:ribose transport system substrate-binding protein